jgi:hypothetical protein
MDGQTFETHPLYALRRWQARVRQYDGKRPRRWTDEEAQAVIKAHKELGMPVRAISEFLGCIITPTAIRNRLYRLGEWDASPHLTPQPDAHIKRDIILSEVAKKHGVSVDDIKGKSRKPYISNARFEAAYRLRREVGFSFNRIGIILGRRDHSTIIHAVRTHAKRLQSGNG